MKNPTLEVGIIIVCKMYFKKYVENHFNSVYHLVRHRWTSKRWEKWNLTFYVKSTVEMIEPSTVVYMQRLGAYGQENTALMQRFKKWIADNALEEAVTAIWAMALDDPAQTEASACRYAVGMRLPVGRTFDPAPVEVREMAGGKYVTFLLPHTAQAMQQAWMECLSSLSELGHIWDKDRQIGRAHV